MSYGIGALGQAQNSYAQPCETVCPESEMASACGRLTSQMQQAQECLERLRQRLESVVRPSVPTIKNDAKAQQIGAPLAQFIDDKASTLGMVNAGLCDLLERLEL